MANVAPRPRLLILAEFIYDGEQYALELGLPSRHAFEVVTHADRLVGHRDGVYRIVGRTDIPFRLGVVLRRTVAASGGRLREATDEDIATIITAWAGA